MLLLLVLKSLKMYILFCPVRSTVCRLDSVVPVLPGVIPTIEQRLPSIVTGTADVSVIFSVMSLNVTVALGSSVFKAVINVRTQ
jgi:hypothetical protein